MPWDATTLRVRPLGPLATAEGAGEDETAASTVGHARVAGADAEGCMSDGDISVQQPAFSPSGALYFISDESGFWNLYSRSNSSSVMLPSARRSIVQPSASPTASTAAASSPSGSWLQSSHGST